MKPLRPEAPVDPLSVTHDGDAVHVCKGRVLAAKLLEYEGQQPMGRPATLVPRGMWLQLLKLANEALEDT